MQLQIQPQTQPQMQPTQQTVPSIAPINPNQIAEQESPTAIILSIAILISMVMGSITHLVRVIGVTRSDRYEKRCDH